MLHFFCGTPLSLSHAQQDGCGMPGLCLLEAGEVLSSWCTMKNASGYCWMFPGGQSHPHEEPFAGELHHGMLVVLQFSQKDIVPGHVDR